MPAWRVHIKIAELLCIDAEVARIVNEIIDIRKPHDGRSEFGAFADKLLEIFRRFNDPQKLMDALMAFHLHHILDIASEKGSLDEGIEEYKQILQDLLEKLKTLQEIRSRMPEVDDILFIERYPSDQEGVSFDDVEALSNKFILIEDSFREILRRLKEGCKGAPEGPYTLLPKGLKDFLDQLDSIEEELGDEDILDAEKILKRIFGERLGEEASMMGGRRINVIPPIGIPGECAEILYVVFGVKDMLDPHTFYSRMFEAHKHIIDTCKGTTKYVVFHVPYGIPKISDTKSFSNFVKRWWGWYISTPAHPAWMAAFITFSEVAKSIGVLTVIKLIRGPRVIIM